MPADNLTVSGAFGPKAAASLIAATTITLRAGYIPGSGFDGFSVAMDLAGSFTAPTLTVATGGGNDDVELHPAVVAANTFVSTGAGNDTIHLYDMPTITAAQQRGHRHGASRRSGRRRRLRDRHHRQHQLRGDRARHRSARQRHERAHHQRHQRSRHLPGAAVPGRRAEFERERRLPAELSSASITTRPSPIA